MFGVNVRSKQWALMILLTIFSVGCATQPTTPPTTEQMLIDTGEMMTNGAIALGYAVNLGTIDPASEEYARAYAALYEGRKVLAMAWESYNNDQIGQAETAAQIAISLYMQARPAFQKYLEE